MKNILFEGFKNYYKKLEEGCFGVDLEESAKTDFINKFGQETFNKFEKAKQRLKNNGYSTDYQQYLKMNDKELQDLILSLYDDKKDAQKKRIISGKDKEIRGKYKYLGEKDGYKVYQPLNYLASMDLGVNTGWCTAGRYGHYGHPEFTPSLNDARKHWKDYTKQGIKFYYFLNPTTMYGEYAIALYPRVLDVYEEYGKYYINKTNIELFNAEDNLDYSSIGKLPLDLIPEKIILDYKELEEVEIEDGVLVKYRGNDKKFVVPNNVTSIGNYAFNLSHNLTSITIPNNVESIGACAFAGCAGLTSIEIPNSVTDIGEYAFYNCVDLKSITIPNSITSISDCVFSACKGLTSITIPNNVTKIGDFAFYGCIKLTSVTISDSVTSIGNNAFCECRGLTNITIPDSVTSIGKSAFYRCSKITVKTNSKYVIDYCQKNDIEVESIR